MAKELTADTSLLDKFFRQYANELLHRADTAGLLLHSATSGSIKEFLCRAVFAQTLPAACSLVTGQGFDGKGNVSRQCDVIVFDDRVPKLEVANGVGMYPVEGIISSIEVKSHLNKTDIESALTNSLALIKLNSILCGGLFLATTEGLKVPQTSEETRTAAAQLSPACYVFSFDACSKETASKHVDNWYLENGCPAFPGVGFAMLPRCIVGRNWVGLLDDGYIEIEKNSVPRGGANNMMVFFDIDEPLIVFLSHLLHKISLRIRATIGSSDRYFSINKLLPIETLLNRVIPMGNPIYLELG